MKSIASLQERLGLRNAISVKPDEVSPQMQVQSRAIESLFQRYGAAPLRYQDFSPFHLHPSVIPFVNLVDIETTDGERSFIFRVCSSELRETIGKDVRGQTVMDFPRRSCRTYLTRLHELVADTGKPMFSSAQLDYPKVTVCTEKTFVPMFADGDDRPCKILTVFSFDFGRYDAADVAVTTEPNGAHERYKFFEDMRQFYIASANGTC